MVIRSRLMVAALLLALPMAVAADEAPAQASALAPMPAATTTPAPAQVRPAARPVQKPGLEGRVQLLASELGLDERQQADVRRILQQQSIEVRRAWNDASLPPQLRIAATRAISDKTAERIRALLTDAQREKYTKARPAMPAQEQSPAELDRWVGAVGGQ